MNYNNLISLKNSGLSTVINAYNEVSSNIPLYLTYTSTFLLSYILLIRYLRNQRSLYLKQLCKETLDGKHSIWWMIVLLSEGELNFEYILSMEFRGLLSTYGIPTISSTLRKTGGFQKEMQRRFADMVLLINEFCENGEDNDSKHDGQVERSNQAILRLNAIHNQYGKLILDRDMLYTLTVFAMTPIVWADTKWSIRPFHKEERQIQYLFWMNIGKKMNIKIPDDWKSYEDCLLFKTEYELKYMKYTDNNKIITNTTIEYFLNSFSWYVKPFVRSIFYNLLSAMQESDLQRNALGLDPPNIYVIYLLDFLLLFRKFIVINFIPPCKLGKRERITSKKGKVINNINISHCPMSTMYYPENDLEFNNKTYIPNKWWRSLLGLSKGYFIENLGPSEVKKGMLIDIPQYLGKDTSNNDD